MTDSERQVQIQRICDPNPDVRAHAAEQLCYSSTIDDAILNALYDALMNEVDSYVAITQSVTLLYLGSHTHIATASLVRCLYHSEEEIRIRTVGEFDSSGLQPIFKTVEPFMVLCLRDRVSDVKYWTLKYFQQVGSTAELYSIREIARLLSDQSVEVRNEAANALGAIGPKAGIELATLVQQALNPNNEARLPAIYALGAVAPDDIGTFSVLTELMEDDDEDVVNIAAIQLKAYPTHVEQNLTALLERMEVCNSNLAFCLAEAICAALTPTETLLDQLREVASMARANQKEFDQMVRSFEERLVRP